MSQVPSTFDALLRRVQAGQETAFDVATAIAGDGTKATSLTVRQRTLNPEPPVAPLKAASPPRAHIFHDVVGFTAYLKTYGGKNTVILANTAAGVITAVLDETVVDGRELIAFTPQKHPLFEPWSNIFDSDESLDADDLVLFLREHRRAIVDPVAARELILLLSQIRVAKSVRMEQGLGANTTNGLMVTQTIQGVNKDEAIDLPETIDISVPLYLATDPVSLTVDLILDASDGGVTARLVCAGIVEQRTALFEKFLSTIKVGALDGAIIGLGSTNYSEWKFLR